MGWAWRFAGALVGAVVALVYVLVASAALSGFAVSMVTHVAHVAPDVAAQRLVDAAVGLTFHVGAAYLALVALSYVHSLLLGAFTPLAPGPLIPAAYLVLSTAVLVVTAVQVVIVLVNLSLEALVVLGAVAVFGVGFGVLVAFGYFAASRLNPTPTPPADSPGESLARGALIGANATMNFILAEIVYWVLLQPLLGGASRSAAIVIAIVLGAVTLSAILASVGLVVGAGPFASAVQGSVEGGLGWFNWLMPASWTVTAPGCAFYYLTWLGHCLSFLLPTTFAPVPYRVEGIGIDPASGVMLVDSGIVGNTDAIAGIGNAPAFTAFNMGCFMFATTGVATAPTGTLSLHQHEAGHGLSLAAFGGLFHYIGAVDQSLPGGAGPIAAYAERIAQSNVDTPSPTFAPVGIVPIWI